MSDTAEGPGAALQDARVALDVTTREVADALNLPVSVVEAMEANDYDRLPQPVFTRGYLRSYARLLELDPAAIVERYPVAAEGRLETAEQEPVTAEPTPALPLDRRILVAAAGLVLALLLVVWLLPGEDSGEESVPPAAAASAAGEPEAAAPAAAAPAVAVTEASVEALPERGAGSQAQPATQASAPVDATERDPLPSAATSTSEAVGEEAGAGARADADGGAEPAEPVALSVAVPEPDSAVALPSEPAAGAPLEAPTPPGFRRITPFGDDELVLTFAEDCWVQVRDLDGVNLYGDLNRAGGTLRLIGRAPFRVRLGYAPGATLTLNGDEVALTRYTRNNVANVVVGR